MRAEVRIKDDAKEPYAVIYTNEITREVSQAVILLNGAGGNKVITVMDEERIVALHPDEIFMVRTENERPVVYCRTAKYTGTRRLYEFEALLGSGFMRISKSTLVNLRHLDYMEPTLGGLMLLVLKNGCKDYISRKYLPSFKKYLGL